MAGLASRFVAAREQGWRVVVDVVVGVQGRSCVEVDNQNLVREGLRSLLKLVEDVEVVGEATDGQKAVDVVPSPKPNLLLLDLRMPVLDGVEVLRQLGARGALPPTLILTTFDEDALLLETIRAAAKGFLLKAFPSNSSPKPSAPCSRAWSWQSSSHIAFSTDRALFVVRYCLTGFQDRSTGPFAGPWLQCVRLPETASREAPYGNRVTCRPRARMAAATQRVGVIGRS